MLFRKEGFPEEDSLVLCTVTNIQYNSVFARLNAYGKQGMIHISEVSPGRIRNIRDFVKEGKIVVCKVLRINTERGHIDLSLRRVNESQRRNTLSDMKQEMKAEKILSIFAEKNKQPVEAFYKQVSEVLLEHYDYIFQAFEDVVENNQSLVMLGLNKEIGEKLEELVKEKIKPKQIEITGDIKISCYVEDGINVVKEALLAAEGVGKNLTIRYLGAGTYKVEVIDKEYKPAEKLLKQAIDKAQAIVEAKKGVFEFKRTD